MVSLGILLSKGADGVQRNAVRAVELFENAIATGNVRALSHLVIPFVTGADGVSSNHPRSVEVYKREDGRTKSIIEYAEALLDFVE